MAIGSSILHPLYLAIGKTYLAGTLDMQKKTIHRVAQPQQLQPPSPQRPCAVNFTASIIRSASAPCWRCGRTVDEVGRTLIQGIREGGAGDQAAFQLNLVIAGEQYFATLVPARRLHDLKALMQ